MRISTLFFDLGSTLVYSKDPWPPIYDLADRALINALTRSGIGIDSADINTEFGGFIRSYYDRPAIDNIEPTSFAILRDLLIRKGIKNVPESVLRSALEAMYAVTQQNWILEEDAPSTLEILKSRGYQMGLISNTSDAINVQGIVDRWNLRSFFDIIVTSAALGVRKPDVRIFQAALDHFHVPPGAAAMVGDMLNADILGANLSGIYSIWITRRARMPEDGDLVIQPQAVVAALSQIPDLLAEIGNDPGAGLT
jgi:HAD superfamily hydrolase (TIGR01662 family)